MINSLTAAASSMSANAQAQEIIARNLANISTTGYRKGVPVFSGFSNALAGAAGNIAPTIVAGSHEAVDFSEGSHTYTDAPLDFAIEGEGFFALQQPDDPANPLYTRKGHFTLNSSRQIVNSLGLPVLNSGGAPITVPPGNGGINVQTDGTVVFGDPAQGTGTALGKLMVVDFPKPYRLERTDFCAFREPGGGQTAQPAENYKVRQGYLEESNVDMLSELVTMIAVMRNFEADQKMISITDQTLKDLIQNV